MADPTVWRFHVLLTVILLLSALGLTPSNGKAEPILFYCEVRSEIDETLVAVAEGNLTLASRAGNTRIPMRASTLRVVHASGQPEAALEIPAHIRAQIDVWREVLNFGRPLAATVAEFFGASLWTSLRIDLGEVMRGEIVQQEVVLPAAAIAEDLFQDFGFEKQFEGPSGVFLDIYPNKTYHPERAVSMIVSATISPDADVAGGDSFAGKVFLRTSDPDFNKKEYSIVVSFRASGAQAGEGGLLGAVRKKKVLYGAALVVVILLGTLYLYWFHLAEPKEKMQGKLKIVRDPSHGKIGTSVFDLQVISYMIKKKTLVFGSGSDADVHLPDDSVKPRHCRVFPVSDKGENKIFITPLDGNPIIIDGRKLTMGNAVLGDGTQITIGKFSLEFESTDFYKQVEIWTADGKILRGVLIQLWDVNSSGFSMVPFTEHLRPDQMLGSYYRFPEINMVKFYRGTTRIHLRKLLTLPQRFTKRALVRFRDDSNIECRVQGYAPKNARYLFALPMRDDKDSDYYFIVRKNVKEVRYI